MEKKRQQVRFVIVGHVDHGKSTLIGRLLADTDSVPEDRINNVRTRCIKQGKDMEYAFLLDALEEEQEQGITIDTTQIQFHTALRDYVIIDAPGHKEFLKNMISGASSADAAFLLIDAAEGVREQSRRHGYILKLLGIGQIAVVVNKMDLLDYSEEGFNRIVEEYTDFLSTIDVKPNCFIPISAKLGENMVHPSENMNWYQGPTVLQVMDALEKGSERAQKPLRFPVQDVYKFDSRRIIAGRIESGSLRKGDKVFCWPQGTSTRIKSIEKWDSAILPTLCAAGESVGVTLEDPLFLERGSIITSDSAFPAVGRSFRANVFWLGKDPLLQGKTYKVKVATQEIDAEVVAIHRVVDSSELSDIPQSSGVGANCVAEITIQAKSPMAFDSFSQIPETGRFVLVDRHEVCGGGIIAGLEEVLGEGVLLNNLADHEKSSVSPAEFNDTESTDKFLRVTPAEREAKNGHPGFVIWISGQEKKAQSSLAKRLEREWFEQGKQVFWLNEENRGEEDKQKQVSEVSRMAQLLVSAGHIVLVSGLSVDRDVTRQLEGIVGSERWANVYLSSSQEVPEALSKVKSLFQKKASVSSKVS